MRYLTIFLLFIPLSMIIFCNFTLCETINIPEDFPTIMEGLYSASSGDTILVAPGTYYGFMWNGTSLMDIHVLGAGAFGDSVSKLMGTGGGNGIFLDEVVDWEIAGFEITNFYHGIQLLCCINLDIHHNYIHDQSGGNSCGFFTEFGDTVNIHHNVVAYNHYVAFLIDLGAENYTIYNNDILHTNNYHGILVMGNHNNMKIINNIIAFNSNDGVQFAGSPQGNAIIEYNDNYGNGSAWSNCTPGIGNIYQNPQFTNTPPSIYSLQAGSPCIDAGHPEYPLDPDGTRADIGALYFDQTLPVVEDLSVSLSEENVILNWADIPLAVEYTVYRSEEPYFAVSGMAPLVVTTHSEYTDVGAINEGKYFYRVTWTDDN